MHSIDSASTSSTPATRGLTARTLVVVAVCGAGVVVWIWLSGWAAGLLPKPHSAEDRFLVHGDGTSQSRLQRDAAVASRFPDDPVAYGCYVTSFLCAQQARGCGDDASMKQFQAQLRRILEGGRTLDPDNAVYDIHLAWQALEPVCRVRQEEGQEYFLEGSFSRRTRYACFATEVDDEEAFQRALGMLRRGLRKPVLSARTSEMLQRRTEAAIRLGEPDLDGLLVTMNVGILPLPGGNVRRLAESLCGRALALAHQGRAAQGRRICADVERLGLLMGAHARRTQEMLDGYDVRMMAMGHEVAIARIAGEPRRLAQAEARLAEENQVYRQALAVGGSLLWTPQVRQAPAWLQGVELASLALAAGAGALLMIAWRRASGPRAGAARKTGRSTVAMGLALAALLTCLMVAGGAHHAREKAASSTAELLRVAQEGEVAQTPLRALQEHFRQQITAAAGPSGRTPVADRSE